MKLLSRRNSRTGDSTPDKSGVAEQPENSNQIIDGSPTSILDFDNEMADKPPGKCMLDVSLLAGNRSNSEPRSRRSWKSNELELDAREADPDPRMANSRNKGRSGSRGRRRVADEPTSSSSSTEQANEFMESSSPQQEKQIYTVPDIFTSLVEPSSSNRKGSRKSKKGIAPMPTLSEADREDESTVGHEQPEEQSSFDSWDEVNLSFEQEPGSAAIPQSPQRKQKEKSQETQKKSTTQNVQPTVTQLLTMDEHKKTVEQIRKIMDEAKVMASEGREEESIQTYKKALHLGRADVHRIKAHLRKPNSLSERFYQDWLEIGVILSEIRTCQAHLHERLLDYDHAISCIQEAISIYRRQSSFFKNRSKDKAATLMKVIGNLEAVVFRIQTAKKHEIKRKQIHQSILQCQRNAAAASTAAQRAEAHQQMETAAENLRELERSVMGDWHPLVADASSLLGAIALEQGKIDGAVNCMKQALTIMKKALGMKHPRTGTKLLNLASVYANQGQDTLAIDHYNMAIAVFRSSTNSTKLVASTLNDVAVIHIRRKEGDQAVALLNESLEMYRKGEHSWDTAQVWRNLGESYCQRRDYANGSSALLNALNIQRDGRALFDKALASSENGIVPDNVPPFHLVDDSSIADTLRRLGKAYFGARKFDYALTYYKEACVIHKAEVKKVVHVSKSRSNMSLPARQDELAQTIYCMAELYDQTGELEQAAKLFSESLQLRLFSDAHKESRSNMVHCAMCLYGMGGIHLKQGEFEDASAVVEQALSYCDAHGIPDTNVIYVMIRSRLDEANKHLAGPSEANVSNESFASETEQETQDGDDEDDDISPSVGEIETLEQSAAEAIKEGDLDEAVSCLTQVMRMRKEVLSALKQKGVQGNSLKYDTACTLYTFGQVLTMQGNLTSAEKAFKDALKLFKKAGTSPEAKVVLQLCDELQKLAGQNSKAEI